MVPMPEEDNDNVIQFRRYKLSLLDLRRQRRYQEKFNPNNHPKLYSPLSSHHNHKEQSLASKTAPSPSSSSSPSSYATGFAAPSTFFHPFYNIRNHSSSRARVILSERIEIGPPFGIPKERSFLFRSQGLEEEEEEDDDNENANDNNINYYSEEEDQSSTHSPLQQRFPLPVPGQDSIDGDRNHRADPEIVIPRLRQQRTFDSYTTSGQQPSTCGGDSLATLKAANTGLQ
jgi:hypothetical protein